ncbi:hypothetical protein [Clostridium botulinum]|uniref:hypothetical protein n=1 Tax=Clostridium botulinum TaxID=1491 RepID=UPI00069FD969|nr:hypothetical protein [Clostridium botulinum]
MGLLKNIWEKAKENDRKMMEEARKKGEKFREKKAELDEQGEVYCPKCLSTQITANKKGFSVKKAVLLGGVGGFIGKNKIEITCLKCGYKWKPGQ